MRRDLVCLFSERVSKVASNGNRFIGARNALQSNGAARIDRIAE
jgi:hypothetical protein